jgi:hypothetical protein
MGDQSDLATGRDGLLVESAAVPAPGTVRLSTGGGAAPAREGGSAEGQVTGSLLWSPGAGLALALEASNQGGGFSPAASARWQLLSQAGAGLDGLVLVRFKSVGFRATGNEVEAGVVLGRTLWGRLGLRLAGVAGRGFAGEEAVDLEGKLAAAWSFSDSLRVGAEARLRAEVKTGPEMAPPPGREYDLLAGPTVSWRIDRVVLQAIAGLGVPRGTAAAGAMGLVQVSFDL